VLVLTLLVRDEADVVGSTVDFHLSKGADFVIATDHRSVDGSREILERYERDGILRLIREDGEIFDSQAFRTRMARMAAEEHGADWVIGADADEFFWPRAGSLPEALAAVPDHFGVVRAPWRFFVPRADGDACFAERMTARLSPGAWLAHPRSAYKPDVKIAHRGRADVVVQGGNHRLLSGGLTVAPWHPIEVLHFPIRSVEQLERKMAHWSRAGRVWAPGRAGISHAQDWFDSVAVSDEVLASGLADGSLAVDTRLRDALRLLRAVGSEDHVTSMAPPGSDTTDEGAFRAALAALGDRALHQLLRRLDDAGERVAQLESESATDGVG
jgi:hypothetical protein